MSPKGLHGRSREHGIFKVLANNNNNNRTIPSLPRYRAPPRQFSTKESGKFSQRSTTCTCERMLCPPLDATPNRLFAPRRCNLSRCSVVLLHLLRWIEEVTQVHRQFIECTHPPNLRGVTVLQTSVGLRSSSCQSATWYSNTRD